MSFEIVFHVVIKGSLYPPPHLLDFKFEITVHIDDDDDDDWLYHSFLNTRVVEGSQSLTE